MAIGKGLNAFVAAYQKALELGQKQQYYELQLMYLKNKLAGHGATGEDAQAGAAGDAAKGYLDKTGKIPGTGGVPLQEGRSAAVGDPVDTTLPPHAKAALNAIAARESGGEYDRLYNGPSSEPTYFEGYDQHPDMGAPGPAGWSTAAGRYQFTKSTWNRMGGGAFDPVNQDRKAWGLAQEDYNARTGRDLNTDLQKNGFTPEIARTLSPTWTSLKNPSDAIATYNSSLQRYTTPPSTGVATPAVTAAPTPAARADNLGQALPIEAGVTAPTSTAAYAPPPEALPITYAGYDPYNTEAVYAAKGGLVPDLRQRWVQHFQGGGDVQPYPLIPVAYSPEGPPQFTYVDPNSPAMGGSPSPNTYGDLIGPRGSPVGPRDFAPSQTSATYSSPYGGLDVPPIGPADFAPETTTPMYSPYGALPLTPASWSPDVPLPPSRPSGLGAAPAAGAGSAVRGVPLPPPRPDDLGGDTEAPAQGQGLNWQLDPNNPIAQVLTGVEHAVSGGIRWLTNTLGFTNGGVQTNTDGTRALANGDHAFSKEEHDAVVNSVDPDNKLSPGVRNMVGMNAMYEYYLTHGSLEKAQKMAAGMLLYSQQYLQRAGDAALRDPDPRSASKTLADGFNQVPNNQHVSVDDSGNFVLKNEATGKVISAGRYNPQQLLAMATGAKDGTVFWKSLNQFVHKDDEVDDKQTAAQKNAQAAAARQEAFSKAMGTDTPSDAPSPGSTPVSGVGIPGGAPAADKEEGEQPDTEDTEGETEGRSASATPAATAQGIPTGAAGAGAGAAPPKSTAKTPEWAAYIGKSAILDDNIKTDAQRAAWGALTTPERNEQRVLWKMRIDQAGQAAKRDAEENAPVPAANKSDVKTQAGVAKAADDAWDKFTENAQGKKDNKTGEVFDKDKIATADVEGFKAITRGIVHQHGGSGPDALNLGMGLVNRAAQQPIPTKKDDNGKDTIDWEQVRKNRPYENRTFKGSQVVIPRGDDGRPDVSSSVRITQNGLNTLNKMSDAAIRNRFEKQQEAAKSGYGNVIPGWARFDKATIPMVQAVPGAAARVARAAPGAIFRGLGEFAAGPESSTDPKYLQDQARRRELLGLGQ